MKTRVWLAIAIGCSTLASCVDTDVDDPATSEDEADVIGGTTDNGDSSVVALFAHAPGASSGSLCTATVISSRKLLTAAHCVDPRVIGSGQVFTVLTGTTLTGPQLAVSGTAFDPAFNPNNITAGHDVAVVTLSAATTLTPIPYNTTALSSSTLSTPIRLVGYGSNTHTNTGAGTKRQATTTVDDYNTLVLHIGTSSKQTCHGDSGGPAFQVVGGVERIVGITSYGQDLSSNNVCYNGGYDTRVDKYAAFIAAHL